MKLYEMSEVYQKLLDNIEFSELTNEQIHEALNNVEDMFSNKVLNIGVFCIELQAECEAIHEEIVRLDNRRNSRQNKIASMKEYLRVNMEACKIDKAKNQFLSVSLQSNPPSVSLMDITLIPDKYWRVIPEIREVDKSSILKTFKENGEIVPGTQVVTDKKHVVIR